MAEESRTKCPQDLVAIFHASFHPTQGNVIDWSLKASDDLNIDGIEFSALPSGLHLVEQDVVYFTKDGQQGVCIFRRRRTVEEGHRGFRLSSLGVLLAQSRRPRPWRHVKDLKDLIERIYSQRETSSLSLPTESQWEPARAFFEERKVRRADLCGAGDWNGWGQELEEVETEAPYTNPTFHLSHLLRILGPSSLTLYKHVLTRRRILIYTHPPVEAACVLCQVAADMCYEMQRDAGDDRPSLPGIGRLKGRSRDPISVLGVITLSDMDRLRSETATGRGWIACTTDAIFLEKPSCYDLLIDLTTSATNKATRPTFYASKTLLPQVQPGKSSTPAHRLSVIRFAWSDVRLWNELDRILRLDCDDPSQRDRCEPSTSGDPGPKAPLVSPWTDAWQVYEDVCVICAGLWMGSWRGGNSVQSYTSVDNSAENWGEILLEGDEDDNLNVGGSAYIRSLGQGIEGRPVQTNGHGVRSRGISSQSQLTIGSPLQGPKNREMRGSSGMSWPSGKGMVGGSSGARIGKTRQTSSSSTVRTENFEVDYRDDEGRKARKLMTCLSLLQTFHAHSSFQLSVLESFLPDSSDGSYGGEDPNTTVYLSPKDVLAFGLGPLSGFDARYLEWLTQEYAGTVKVVVKRGWKDLLSAIFGYT